MRRIARELAIPLIAGATVLGSFLAHRYEPAPMHTEAHASPRVPADQPHVPTGTHASAARPSGAETKPTPPSEPNQASAKPAIHATPSAPTNATEEDPASTAPIPSPPRPTSDLEGRISPWQAAAISRMSVVEPLARDISLTFGTDEATVYGIVLSESSLYPDATGPLRREGLVQYEPQDFARATHLPVSISTTYAPDPIRNDAFDPGSALRAYEMQMVALRAASGLTDLVELHALRAAPGVVYDPHAYLETPTARADIARIDTHISQARRLLAFNADSKELAALRSGSGSTNERLRQQYDATIRLADRTSGQFRLAYLTNAVSYARVLGSTATIRTALDRAANEADITAGISTLETRLDEPLGIQGP